MALNKPESLDKRFFSLHTLSGRSEDADVTILMAFAMMDAVDSRSLGTPRDSCGGVDPP